MWSRSLAGRVCVVPVVLFLFPPILSASSEQSRVPASQAVSYVGETVTLCGDVTAVEDAPEAPGQVFIRVDQLKIVVDPGSRRRFVGWERIQPGKRVCVTGLVESAANCLQIVAKQPEQIRIADASSRHAVSKPELGLPDAEVRQLLVRRSKAGYPGACPCPDSTDSAGRRCGKRSAYSKPGGAAPLCYPADVTDEMIRDYRKQNGN